MVGFILLAFAAVLTILRGWVLSKLWGWFVLPLFPAMPHLNFLQAAGLLAVVSFMTYTPTVSKESESAELITNAAVYPLLALLFGWVLKSLM